MLKCYENFNIDGILVDFTIPDKRPNRFTEERVFYPINLDEFIVSNFDERVFQAEYRFTIEVLLLFDKRYALFYMKKIENDNYTFYNEFNYALQSNNINSCNIFDFIIVIDKNFLDDEFVFGSISYEIYPRTIDLIFIFIKNGLVSEVPQDLKTVIHNEVKYINLGDFFNKGIDMYVDRNFDIFLKGLVS